MATMSRAELPKALRGFVCHGLEVDIRGEGNEAQGWGYCHFCGEDNKFCVAASTGKWDCKRCKKHGNIYTFLRELHKASMAQTGPKDYQELTQHRKLLFAETPKYWGVCKSVISGEWLVPGYNHESKLNNLYRYVEIQKKGKKVWALLATDEITHYLHGVNLYNKDKPDLFLCEGPWDGMALWEMLRFSTLDSGKLIAQTPLKSPNNLTNANVLAVPGASVFFPSWAPLFAGKKVTILFDSDHESINNVNGNPIPNSSAGFVGTKRVYSILHSVPTPTPTSSDAPTATATTPAEVNYLHWGVKGFDPDLPDGYDIRDHISPGRTVRERVSLLKGLLSRIAPASVEWKGAKKEGQSDRILPTPCDNYAKLVNQWRKALKWTEGLDHGLSCGLACIMSVPLTDDQVWIRMISPPSTGKTNLCEAFAIATRFVHPESNIRGFHSGYVSKDGKDHSLLVKIKDKTLVTKDGDTLLRAPNKDQILSEARDVYDTASRSNYRHGQGRAYEGYRCAWLLAGTNALHELDRSELGQRFLTVVMMNDIPEDLERTIGRRKGMSIINNRTVANGLSIASNFPEELGKAMSLTGGYINYLRDNVLELYRSISGGEALVDVTEPLGRFVAYMRARPAKSDEQTEAREMSPRLVAQLTKLGLCLAVVKNKTSVDEKILNQVVRVGFDTARGKTLDIVKYLHKVNEGHLDVMAARFFSFEESKGKSYISFLRRLGVLRTENKMVNSSVKGSARWMLTPQIRKLYTDLIRHYSELEE